MGDNMKKLTFYLVVFLISTGVFAQPGGTPGGGDSGSSTGASTTYNFETAIDGLWQYNSSADVYYIVGLYYCSVPADTTYEQMGIFVRALT
jgi:hypothetical protein